MANKRIELEQYKHYVDLLEEEPNRKKWRRGLMIALIGATVLALALFVMGMMSGSLASNPRNVLEKPPEKTPTTPSGTDVPGGIPSNTNIPGGDQPIQIPGGQQQVPQGVPVTPDQSEAPESPLARTTRGIPFGAGDGALLAQAQPDTQQAQPVPAEPAPTPQLDETTPGQVPTGAPDVQQSEQSQAEKPVGPDKQTKGIGNLANMTNGAGGRGLQLYLLVLFIGLCVVLYLPIRKARLEGKAK